VLRYGYARQAADRLGVPVDLLWRRLGGRVGSAPEEEARRPTGVVQSEEEKALHLLLAGQRPPDGEELPPPAAFFDRDLREIYEAWSGLLAAGGRAGAREVIEALGGQSPTVARLVQDELHSAATPGSGELSAALAKLRRRWQRQRARELTAEIAEAERRGDDETVDSLLHEKASLSRALHPRH
jgi:hypothetical protein